MQTQVGGDHYKKLAIQPMEYAFKNHLDPLQFSVVKYITRFRDKAGEVDLNKAKHCIDMLIEMEYGAKSNGNAVDGKVHPFFSMSSKPNEKEKVLLFKTDGTACFGFRCVGRWFVVDAEIKDGMANSYVMEYPESAFTGWMRLK